MEKLNQQITLTCDSKVYIACTANFASGGPELLHQLAYHLRMNNVDAHMYYLLNKDSVNNIVHENYKKYAVPYVLSIHDNKDNVLIIPEMLLKLVAKYCEVRTIIWWLSVDNAFFQFESKLIKLLRRIFVSQYSLLSFLYNKSLKNAKIRLLGFLKKNQDKLIENWVQSHYAFNFLHNSNIRNIRLVSDYLAKEFLESGGYDESLKENIVIYNPKKGKKFTRSFIDYCGEDIKFIALENMSYNQVIGELKRAKVYIDFGEHPGKDRIPREAAILGCCVITGKKGSANYFEDVSIPDKFKFEDVDIQFNNMKDLIINCFDDYRKYSMELDCYRDKIKNELTIFTQSVKDIFIKKFDVSCK